MQQRLLVFLVALLVAGCASSPRVRTAPETVSVTSYELGQVQEGATGDAIIRVARGSSSPAFSPLRRFTAPRVGPPDQALVRMPDLEPGQEWEAGYRPEKGGDAYVLRHEAFGDKAIHILPDGTVGKGWVSLSGDALAQGRDAWPRDEPLFERVPGTLEEGRFRAELVYSGKSNDVIRLIYREYLDDMARPAFAQELEYDLKESTRIAFKSLVIEVLEATNNGIRFEVVEDGGLPWVPAV